MNRTVQDIYPLSPTQRGILFHSLYGAGVYVVQVGYTLRGNLNRDAFEQAWQQLIDRHTILRTAFVWDNLEAPVQVVGQRASLSISWLDWQGLKPTQQQQALANWLTTDRQQGFNLSAAPLMRLTVVQLTPERDSSYGPVSEYRIIWTHHHILLDGWSLPALLREWIVYYQAACVKQVAQFSPALPYRDYIVWLQQQNLDKARQFWQAQLSDITAPTPLGIDHMPALAGAPQPPTQYAERPQALSTVLTQQLKAFAQRHRLTLSSLVQGAWAHILSCYSGEPTVLYGLACAGRPSSLSAADTRVGLFINTLPMRVEVASDSELIPWLQQIQAQQLAIQPYEYTPLVDIQAVSDIPRGLPLFESIVVFENYPIEPRQGIGELNLLDVTVHEQTHYPLTLFAVATETLNFKALYDQQRFSEAAIERLLGHFQTVLSTMLQLSEGTLRDLSILSPAERQQLLEYGQAFTNRAPEQCVHAAIANQATQAPDATAIIFNGDSLSYSQLNQQANQLAHYLQQQGIVPGSLIGVCLRRSIDMVITLLAILKAGCTYVPLDPTYPAARLGYATEDADLSWIICETATHSILNLDIQQIDLNRIASKVASQPATDFTENTDLESLAYLIYTSGSTGKPKGVPILHRSLSNLLGAMARRLHIKPTDTLMAVTTLAFDIAALELFLPLVTGARLLLASDEMIRDGHQLIAHLDAYGVDIMQATPATWRLLINSGWGGQSGLKILCGGEALDVALAQQLLRGAEEVWNVYGPTETTIWSSALALSADQLTPGDVPIGHPIDNTQFYVLDPQQRPVPIGVAGELCIGGMGLAQGYWQQPELTSGKFVANPFLEGGRRKAEGGREALSSVLRPPSSVLYKTGDRVRYREDGTLDYLGRFDQQTKLRGYRIELGEIETAIMVHKQVSQAVVVVRGEQPEHHQLVAYVTLFNRNNEKWAVGRELRSHLTQFLPSYMIPTAYQVLETFPLTPNGKVDRNALPEPESPTTTADNRPKTSVEKTLADIWKSLLNLDTVGIHDSFFEVGGHSLLVINAQSQIRQKLGVELSVMDLFRYPTLSTLATYIGQIQTGKPEEDATDRTVARATGKQRLKQQLQKRRSAEKMGGATK
ncbi:MAG: amino acid adenylation domain-containing protein [Cyanobacteria bacterium P01_F01_bin.4]